MMMRTISFLVSLCLCGVWRCTAISCKVDDSEECEKLVGEGSKCREDGFCSAPQLERGCLQAMIPDWTRKRVCNSEDPPNAQEIGLCERPELPYTEIRLFGGNWDSSIYQTWLVQIILSELLGVPTTVEGGVKEATLNFYDTSKPLNYGIAGFPQDNHKSFQRGYELGDCTLQPSRNNNQDEDNGTYEGCAHAILELWNSELDEITGGVRSGLFETPTSEGMLGREALFITKYTLEQNPSFGNYLGLAGEARRKLLAAKFLRPFTWKDYCEQISVDNCTKDDGVATHYPYPDEEGNRFFVEGFYTGHFGATQENDCTLNNQTFKCTGHVGDYPCDWSSFLEAGVHHLGIALQSSGNQPNSRGYIYQELVDMWHAANATKSNLIMYYWTPETLYQEFVGTDAEMVPVTFPATTQECLENTVPMEDTCSESLEVRIGSPLGVCEAPITALKKLLVSSLRQVSKNPNDPEAIHSPAYDTIRAFQFSEYQLGEIIQHVEKEPSPRLAVCRWAAENMDYLQQFSPQSYPRVIQVNMNNILPIITTTTGCLVTLVVLWTAWRIYQHREAHIIKLAQIHFLSLPLAGLLMICIGAILTGLKPQTATCIASVWLINVGYTLELIPLIVKVGAICRLMAAARRTEAVTFSRGKLFGAVAIVLGLIVLYLSIWSAVDPPKQQAEYSLVVEEEESGETIVQKSYYCSSEANMWQYVAVAWNVALLLCASVMAFLMRGAHAVLNESGTLAVLVYSHFFFVVFRVATFLLSGRVEENILMQARSLIYSMDTIATVLIYFAPKLWAVNNDIRMHQVRLSTMVAEVSRKRFSMFMSRLHQTKEFGSGPVLEAEVEEADCTIGLTELDSHQPAPTELDSHQPALTELGKDDFSKEELKKAPSRVGAHHVGGSSWQRDGRNRALKRKNTPSYVGAHHVGGTSNSNSSAPVQIGAQHVGARSDGNSRDRDARVMRKILQERSSVHTSGASPPQIGAMHCTPNRSPSCNNLQMSEEFAHTEDEDKVMRKILQERISMQSGEAPPNNLLAETLLQSPSEQRSTDNKEEEEGEVGMATNQQAQDDHWQDEDGGDESCVLQENSSHQDDETTGTEDGDESCVFQEDTTDTDDGK